MRNVTAMACFCLMMWATTASAQEAETEFIFDPPRTGHLDDAFAVGAQNGARGLSGPWDLDNDGQVEVLVAQHNSAGGRVHVIENRGVDTWELVYSTALIDSSASSSNARYATGADLDGDGNMEIVYVAGTGYNRDLNPALENGVYVWEHDGVAGSDNYGTLPATVGNFFLLDGVEDSFVRAQNLEAVDIDGDGVQELLVPADGDGDHDIMYVLSVSGTFEPNGVGTGFEVWQIERRVGPREDGNAFGGGSPYDIIAADLNGDGNLDLSYHTWNNFNFFNATVTGPDTIVLPEITDENRFFKASPNDHVALFGGTAFDIDGDGNDEVFYPNWFSKNTSVLNYDQGENVLEITADNIAYDIIPIGGSGGIAVGDVDGDGFAELYTGGPGYSAASFNNGDPSRFITYAEYRGGDPTDGSNYFVGSFDTSHPADTTGFHTIFRDSLGTMTKYFETAIVKQGTFGFDPFDGVFPSGIAYLGDADGDDQAEIAISFQSVDDSLFIIDEVWDPASVTGIFDTPVGEASPGPIGPGQAYEFTVTAAPGTRLSFATMFIPSNDLFFAPSESGLALYDDEGNPREGDVTSDISLWDAGTEENQEPGAGNNQAPNQGAPNTGPADANTAIRLVDDGFTYPAVNAVMRVTLTPDAANTFVVRIENVSTNETLNGNGPVPLAPGAWVLHESAGALFTEGGTAGAGLESLAEDGDPSTIATELERAFGFVRTVRERIEAPVRAFMRILELPANLRVATDDRDEVPDGYALSPNYPNPFNPSTSFTFTLPLDQRVSVHIYDILGRRVRTLVNDERYTAGTHQVTWDGLSGTGTPVASGTYLYTLEYGTFRLSRTMLLVK